jgi:hypothetical protein
MNRLDLNYPDSFKRKDRSRPKSNLPFSSIKSRSPNPRQQSLGLYSPKKYKSTLNSEIKEKNLLSRSIPTSGMILNPTLKTGIISVKA